MLQQEKKGQNGKMRTSAGLLLPPLVHCKAHGRPPSLLYTTASKGGRSNAQVGNGIAGTASSAIHGVQSTQQDVKRKALFSNYKGHTKIKGPHAILQALFFGQFLCSFQAYFSLPQVTVSYYPTPC